MKYKYDLHLHSNWSDGDHPLTKIFQIAKKNNLRGLTITDHNVIASDKELDHFKKQCQKNSIEVFEGVEITTNYKGVDIHVLGYSSKFNKQILRKGLKKTVAGYAKRCQEISQKLEKFFNFKINFNKIQKERGAYKFLTKFDIARAIQKKAKKNIETIIDLTTRGKVAYVPYNSSWVMNPFQAIELIKKAGGITVVAHPLTLGRSNFDKEKTEKIIIELIKKLKKQGLDGIEVYYSMHSKKQEKILSALAKKYALLITGGSDWHGEKNKPSIKIGMAGLDEKLFRKFKDYVNH